MWRRMWGDAPPKRPQDGVEGVDAWGGGGGKMGTKASDGALCPSDSWKMRVVS